jgi:hypothetical protein
VIVRRAIADNPATAQLDHAVSHARNLAVMRDDQHGLTRVCLFMEQFQNLDACFEVQFAGWLVGQEHRIARRQGACNGNPLLLTARKLVREVVQTIAQADLVKTWLAVAMAFLRPLTSRANCTFSSAVRPGNRLKVWKMKLTVSRRNLRRSTRLVLISP